MIGIEFIFKSGDKESYDPIRYPEDYSETDTHIILNMAYTYEIEKHKVKSIRHYEICDNCGYELKNNICEYCGYLNNKL